MSNEEQIQTIAEERSPVLDEMISHKLTELREMGIPPHEKAILYEEYLQVA